MNAVARALSLLVMTVVFALSALGEAPQSGEKAPDFSLKDTKGTEVRLSEVVGEATTVLVFYRGHW